MRDRDLPEHTVHAWCIDLTPDPSTLPRLSAMLSAEERVRAGKFHRDRDRVRYTVAHAELRRILGWYSGDAPARLRFSIDSRGKPDLVGSTGAKRLRFNLSHSSDRALVGVVWDHAIGVDIELSHRIRELDAVAKRYFSARERAALDRLGPDRKLEGFYHCWTRKEAYVKATGEGLSRSLQEFDVTLASTDPVRFIRIGDDPVEPGRWSLFHLEPVPSYVGAVAVQAEGVTLRLMDETAFNSAHAHEDVPGPAPARPAR